MGLNHLSDDDVKDSFGIPNGKSAATSSLMGTKNTQSTKVPSELIDYNDEFKMASPIMFRDQIISEIYAVLLAKKKPNVLLVGPAGSGKTALAEEVARQIANKDIVVPNALANMTVYELPLSNLVAGSSMLGDLEQKTQNIINFAEHKPVILFIDEIHLLMDHNQVYDKIAQILKPALARGNMHVIGATTTQETRDLLSDPAFNRRFSQITVDEISQEQEESLLEKALPELLKHYNNQIDFPPELLKDVVKISDDVLRPTTHRPDSGLTLLDRVMGESIANKQLLISQLIDQGQTQTAKVLQSDPKTHINLHILNKTATKIVSGLQNQPDLNKDGLTKALKPVMYQDNAKKQVINLLLAHQLGIFNKQQPLSILLIGSSGVGKTMLSKLVAQYVTKTDPIILNMTEYNSDMAITRILGSTAGYIGSDSHAELPFDILDSNPYQVILLDEFEKASQAVQRLFMRVLDEGKLQLANNHLLDFSKTIIFITTNAGNSNHGDHLVGFNNENTIKPADELKNSFDNEVLNRFSTIIKFEALTQNDFNNIMQVQYKNLYQDLKQKVNNLPLKLSDQVIKELDEKFYDKAFGARPVTKAIEYYIQSLM